MKKFVMVILFLTSLVYANLFDDGIKAYNSKDYKKAANQGNKLAKKNLQILQEKLNAKTKLFGVIRMVYG